MTYSVKPSYQEQMGFSFGGEGEFSGLGAQKETKVDTSQDDNQEDNIPTEETLADRVSDFLGTVASVASDTVSKVKGYQLFKGGIFSMPNPEVYNPKSKYYKDVNLGYKPPKTIYEKYNLEQNTDIGYRTDTLSSAFYDDAIDQKAEQLGSFINYSKEDLDHLSDLYTKRRNARFEERLERMFELEKKKEEVKEVKEPVSNKSRGFLSDMKLYKELRDKKRDRELDNIKPRRRPLGLSAKGNLQGLY